MECTFRKLQSNFTFMDYTNLDSGVLVVEFCIDKIKQNKRIFYFCVIIIPPNHLTVFDHFVYFQVQVLKGKWKWWCVKTCPVCRFQGLKYPEVEEIKN